MKPAVRNVLCGSSMGSLLGYHIRKPYNEYEMPRARAQSVEPKCTLGEFNGAIAFFSLLPETIERLEKVLVHGVPLPRVAEAAGISAQVLRRPCSKVMKEVEKLRARIPDRVVAPEGWESAVLVAPTEFWEETRRRLDRYVKGLETPSKAPPRRRAG